MTSQILSKELQNVAFCQRPRIRKIANLWGSHCRYRQYTQGVQEDPRLKHNLRELLRNVAQPVAVITSFMPKSTSESPSNLRRENRPADTAHQTSKFHGATLSSFTSIAMDPYPLVTFALRVPSRMATTLSLLPASDPAHMVVNLLSAEQSGAAVLFSRPDLHPAPFEDPRVRYKLSREGLPILSGTIGALSCQLVGRGIPLHDLAYLGGGNGFGDAGASKVVLGTGDITSELFIARVMRVETNSTDVEPLVYHRRGYTRCPPKPSSASFDFKPTFGANPGHG